MPKRVLCKFFAHGACLKGELCEFSHDWKAPPNNVCTFYQKGICAYGSHCRYEHVKLSQLQSSAPTSGGVSVPAENLSGTAACGAGVGPVMTGEHSASLGPLSPPIRSAWKEKLGHQDILVDDCNGGCYSNDDPVNRPICSFAEIGDCPHGEKCPHIHGDRCPICGKRCLHPSRPHERELHIKACERRQKHLEALRKSQELECSVCLELILSKPTLGERKFGILSECDHPFCISCIRSWRSSSPASGLDVNSALRACPICRKLSYFVVPSVIWYSSKEEKQDIITCYKAKLSSIDCKYFDFGNGACPFGTSCFYKHAYHVGGLEEVVLHHIGADDRRALIAKNIRLSNFLMNLQIR